MACKLDSVFVTMKYATQTAFDMSVSPVLRDRTMKTFWVVKATTKKATFHLLIQNGNQQKASVDCQVFCLNLWMNHNEPPRKKKSLPQKSSALRHTRCLHHWGATNSLTYGVLVARMTWQTCHRLGSCLKRKPMGCFRHSSYLRYIKVCVCGCVYRYIYMIYRWLD